MWNCERVYPWYIPMNHKSSWLIQFFRGEIAKISMVNPEVRPGGKGKDSKDPNTVRKPLDWRLNLKKNEKKWGLDWGTWERIWERLHEIMRSLENMSPFSILMIFFETYWGCNGDMGDLMSVLLMSFMHFILPNRRGFIFWREPLGKTGVNNP